MAVDVIGKAAAALLAGVMAIVTVIVVAVVVVKLAPVAFEAGSENKEAASDGAKQLPGVAGLLAYWWVFLVVPGGIGAVVALVALARREGGV